MNNINLDDYKAPISHAPYRNQPLESSEIYAYQIDNGFSKNLGFNEGYLSQADYFLLDDNKIQIIELTRLEDEIKKISHRDDEFISSVDKFINDIEQKLSIISSKEQESKGQLQEIERTLTKFKTSSDKLKKDFRKKNWAEIVSENTRKWMGTIAILERYCRRIQKEDDFEYVRFLIVLSDNTAPRILESLKFKLKESISEDNEIHKLISELEHLVTNDKSETKNTNKDEIKQILINVHLALRGHFKGKNIKVQVCRTCDIEKVLTKEIVNGKQ